jgi:probable rRNA maturation factor
MPTPIEDAPAPTAELLVRYRGHRADWPGFRVFLARLAGEVAAAPYTVAIVSDRAIRELNRRFRHKDYATDVLSFPSGERRTRRGAQPALGDIVISAPTAARAALENSWKLDDELRALALHGVLHLLGLDHETDRGQMARAERMWGRRLGLPQTLIARQYPKTPRKSPRKACS